MLVTKKYWQYLGITQKSAWFLVQRLRLAMERNNTPFAEPVKVDETYFGGRRSRMRNSIRKSLEGTVRGPVGKTAIVVAKDCANSNVAAAAARSTDAKTSHGFASKHVSPVVPGAMATTTMEREPS